MRRAILIILRMPFYPPGVAALALWNIVLILFAIVVHDGWLLIFLPLVIFANFWAGGDFDASKIEWWVPEQLEEFSEAHRKLWDWALGY